MAKKFKKVLISLIVFAIMGFTTMLAQPVILVWAQRILPKYRSVVAGLINGFCWGIIALCLSMLGLIAEKFGIVNVLIVLTVLPVVSSFAIKYLKDEKINLP